MHRSVLIKYFFFYPSLVKNQIIKKKEKQAIVDYSEEWKNSADGTAKIFLT